MFCTPLVLLLFYSACECNIPCSTANSEASVIDICSSGTIKLDPVDHNILLKVTTMNICQCMLSVLSSDINVIAIFLSKYHNLDSSSPGEQACGVGVRVSKPGNFRDIQCFFNGGFVYSLDWNHAINISSFKIDGVLRPGKGYCVEITTDTYYQYLQLKCGIGSSTAPTHQITTNSQLSTGTLLMVTDSTSSQILYISTGVTTGTVVVIAVFIILLVVVRRYRTKTEIAVSSNAIPAYDDLVAVPNDNIDNYTDLHQNSRITYEDCSSNNNRHMPSTSNMHKNSNLKDTCFNNPKKTLNSVSKDSIFSNKTTQYVNTTFNLPDDFNRHQYTNEM